MTRPRLFRWTLVCTMFLAVVFSSLVRAQTSLGEKQKIELLIEEIARLTETKFVRNGSTYRAGTAAMFLRLKWQANDSAVKTARDFIDKVASFSGTSGKPYLIRMPDGTEVRSRDFLLAALKKLEKPMSHASGG